MNKIYISVVTAALLSTSAFAESKSINEAFANGKTSGDISIYGESISKKGSNKDSGFAMTSIGIAYETDTLNGFKASIAARTNHKLGEREDHDYSDGTDPEVALSTANISYTTDKANLIVGRQEIDLEWIGDFHEAVVGEFTYIPDTTVTIGHSERYMAVDNDAPLEKMAEFGVNDHGVTFIDAKYEGIANTVINPYFMHSEDTGEAYGLKATTTFANIDLTAHYAATNEDISGKDDGDIAHLEIATTVSDISLALGYITTDSNGGIGSISVVGDNIDPTEDIGDQVYGTNADTIYANISAEVASINLSAQYATVNYDDNGSHNDRISEILLTAGTNITDELSIDVLYSSVDAEHSDDDTDKVLVMATYSF